MAPAPAFLLRCALLAAALSVATGTALAGPASLALVPMPREVVFRTGGAALGPEWVVSSTGADDGEAARLLAGEAASGYRWTWRVVVAGDRPRTIELRAIAPPADAPALFAEQGYTLDITGERMVISGATAQGRLYGVQTLRQLMRAHPDGAIPCLRIRDYPAMAWRGVSDDISRGQVSTVADFKDIIRQLAYYKVNLYQLYIEDMFRFEASRTSGGQRGALTGSELAQLVEEGRRNHVVVSPIFETLAHQERLLSLDEHRRFAADDATGSGWEPLRRAARNLFRWLMPPRAGETAAPAAFSADDPRALRFVQSLVDEIAVVTRGPFFHIGGDEWQAPAATGAGGVRAYGRYLGSLARHLEDHYGCRAMVYGDVILEHSEAARDLPREVVVVDWHYDPQDSFPSLGRLEREGFRDVIVSPGLWTWRTFYPNYARAFRNVAAFAQAGKREGAIGCITAAWGDGGAENLRENNWAGYAFSAAAAWEPGVPPEEPFLRRFVAVHYGIDSPALSRAERLLGWQEFERVGWAGRLYHRALPVRPRPDSTVQRMVALKADMLEAEQDLDASEAVVRFHQDHLAAARHCARRYRYIAERELALDGAGRILEGRTAAQLSPAERERMARDLNRLAATADSLRAEFGRLWVMHNRPEGLELNAQRMAKQGAMLKRLSELARLGRLRVDRTYSDMQALGAASDEPQPEGDRP
jgi:hypothetical protein